MMMKHWNRYLGFLTVLVLVAPGLGRAEEAAKPSSTLTCKVFAVVKWVKEWDSKRNEVVSYLDEFDAKKPEVTCKGGCKHDYQTTFKKSDGNDRLKSIPVESVEECKKWADVQLKAYKSLPHYWTEKDVKKSSSEPYADDSRYTIISEIARIREFEFQDEMKWQIDGSGYIK
jgi:hypothetical protein